MNNNEYNIEQKERIFSQYQQLKGVKSPYDARLGRAIARAGAILKKTPEELGEMAFKLFEAHGLPLEFIEDELIKYYGQ